MAIGAITRRCYNNLLMVGCTVIFVDGVVKWPNGLGVNHSVFIKASSPPLCHRAASRQLQSEHVFVEPPGARAYEGFIKKLEALMCRSVTCLIASYYCIWRLGNCLNVFIIAIMYTIIFKNLSDRIKFYLVF